MRKKQNEPGEQPTFMVRGKKMTQEEFMGLPFPERAAVYLPGTRYAAEVCAFWKTCRLPPCRRAKACRGEVRPDADMPSWQLAFPPCTRGDEELKWKLINTVTRLQDELRAKHRK